MGMVRKYQPNAITNLRYGWIGDITEEEGPRQTRGPIRNEAYQDKCLTITRGPWGYTPRALTAEGNMSCDELVQYLANCAIRNMTLLLNVSPDRHGVIPQVQQQRLRELGAWLKRTGDAIYGTRGGPWQPVDGQYGTTYKKSTVFVHLLREYSGDTFLVPPMGRLAVRKVYDVHSDKPLPYSKRADGSIEVKNINRTTSPSDTIIGVLYNRPIVSVWKN